MIRSLNDFFATGLTVLTLTSVLTGCVTNAPAGDTLSGADVSVVERSKEQAPTWMEQDPAVLHDGDAQLKMIEMQTRILNLPLGLKQTQLAAIESHRRTVTAKLKVALQERASSEGIDINNATAELERHVVAVIDTRHGEVARVADIYFEKLVNDRIAANTAGAEFYQVYVLVQMPRSEFDGMMQLTARRLAQSSNPSLRRLGQAMLRSPGLSH